MTIKTPSTMEFVEPCLVRLRLFGKLDHIELSDLIDRFEPLVQHRDYWALEVDMTEIAGATPDARRVGAERLSAMPRMYVAIVTRGFPQRMIARLVLTALKVLKPGHAVTGFFSERDASLAWLQHCVEHDREP